MEADKQQIRHSKFENDDERRKAILASKRNYYKRNDELYKLKSLRTYYVKQLEKTDLTETKRKTYQERLNEIETKLIGMKPVKKEPKKK